MGERGGDGLFGELGKFGRKGDFGFIGLCGFEGILGLDGIMGFLGVLGLKGEKGDVVGDGIIGEWMIEVMFYLRNKELFLEYIIFMR